MLVRLVGHQVLELGVEGAGRSASLSWVLIIKAWLLGRVLANPLGFHLGLLAILLLLVDEIAVASGQQGWIVAVFLLGPHLNLLAVIHVSCTRSAELLVAA